MLFGICDAKSGSWDRVKRSFARCYLFGCGQRGARPLEPFWKTLVRTSSIYCFVLLLVFVLPYFSQFGVDQRHYQGKTEFVPILP